MDRGGGRKDQFLHPMFRHHVEQMDAMRDVRDWNLPGSLADFSTTHKAAKRMMAFNALRLKKPIQPPTIPQIAVPEDGLRMHCRTVTLR
jgi:hypothetical protein